MIAKIFGKIIKKSPSSIMVLTGGIGFEILISSRTFEKIPEVGSEAELDIYTHVREDELKLVGFLDLSDKNFFLKLISVSGISIKIALSALSIYSGEELGRIISTREVDLLRRIPGIGLKLAERMIVELKDKLDDVKMSGIIRPGMEENEEKNDINPKHIKVDIELDKSLRPRSISEFIGQEKIVENLLVFIKSAKKRKEPLDHVILSGPPGLGKTCLAEIIANELGVGFRITSGPAIERAGDLAAILTNLEKFDVLFVDEIHRLNRSG